MKLSRVKALPRGGSTPSGAIAGIADALAEPLRVQILRALSREPASISALATTLDLKEEVVSYHLVNVLEKNHRLVFGEEDGTYSLATAQIARGERCLRRIAETLESLDSGFSARQLQPDAYRLLSLSDLLPANGSAIGPSAAWRLRRDNGEVLLGAQLSRSADATDVRMSIFMAYFCEFERGVVSHHVPVSYIAKLPAGLVETLPVAGLGDNEPLLLAGQIFNGGIYVRSLATPPLVFEVNAPVGCNGERVP